MRLSYLPATSCLLAGLILAPLHSEGALLVPSPASPRIHLLTGTFSTPAQKDAAFLSFLKVETQVALLQFSGPVLPEWERAVEGAGVELLRYIPDFGFVARGEGEAFRAAAKLAFVRWIGPYRPEYRISPAFPDGAQEVIGVLSLEEFGDAKRVIEQAIRRGLDIRKTGERTLRLRGSAASIRELSRLDDTAFISLPLSPRLHNDRSRILTGVNPVWDTLGLYGEGQTVGILDTGLDSGDTATLSEEFHGRVAKGIPMSKGGDWADDHGHGTHIAGAIAGHGQLKDGKTDPDSFAGVAPRARLVVQALELDSRGIYDDSLLDDLGQLFGEAYRYGARVHNDSWGDDFSPYGSYSLHSSQVDRFIWELPEMTVVFAAGNDGSDSPVVGASPLETRGIRKQPGPGIVNEGSLYAPGTAKNVITVGASEGNRPPNENWGGYTQARWRLWGFFTAPISTDYLSDHPEGMTPFSSRGPTSDGRIKPDIVAPGSNIISALSQKGAASRMWGGHGKGYAFNGGTSIAAGFVSGAAALVREWHEKRYGSPPSAAMVKAILLNGGRELAPGQYGGSPRDEIPPRPNSVEGWGRLDLAGALAPITPLSTHASDIRSGLRTNERRSFLYRVREGGHPLRLMLAWSDYPGAPEASVSLVNDLDLVLLTPEGETLHGNGALDRRNNVEGVIREAVSPGVYRVTISAFNVPKGPQPFALAVIGAGGRLVTPGDVDGDGAVRITDVVRALRAATGGIALSEDELLAADVSPQALSQGRVDVLDVSAILRAAVGLADLSSN